MSGIISTFKEALNPKARSEATIPTYAPKTRGAYADVPATDINEADPPRAAPPTDPVSDRHKKTAPDAPAKAATNTGYNAPEGTYGPHGSRIANALDPRVDSDRDGRPKHGVSGLGGAAAKQEEK